MSYIQILIYNVIYNRIIQMLVGKKKRVVKKPKILVLLPNNERSKSRSASCNKSKQNIRLKTKSDLFDEIKRPKDQKNKIYASLHVDPEKSTGNDRRINFQSVFPFQQSDKFGTRKKKKNVASPTSKKRIKTNPSQSFIFKNDIIRKRQIHSAMEVKKKSKDKLNKSKKIKPIHSTETIITKQKKINRVNTKEDQDNLERFYNPLLLQYSNLMSVTSSDDIAFSSNRISGVQEKNQMIESKNYDNQNQLDPNVLLRINLKKQFKRKVAAVMKIQKIWRGYQTRKLLRQYITQEQPKLQQLLQQIKSQHEISQENSEQLKQQDKKSALEEQIIAQYKKTSSSNMFKKKQINYSFKEPTEQEQDIVDKWEAEQEKNIQQKISGLQFSNKLQVNQENYNEFAPLRRSGERATQQKNQSFNTVKIISEDEISKKKNDLSDIQIQKQQPKIVQQPAAFQSEHSSQDSENGEIDLRLYRHQKTIYSHLDIHDYLQQNKNKEQSDQDYEAEQNDYYEGSEDMCHVIMQTNEQYLESRKSSLQNKKLSKIDPNPDSRKLSREINERKGSKQNKFLVTYPVLVQEQKQENSDKEDSTKDQYKNKVAKIKHQQIVKWNQMIEFINSHIGNLDKHSSEIMQKIVMQSETNKKLLEKGDIENLDTRMDTQDEIVIIPLKKIEITPPSIKQQKKNNIQKQIIIISQKKKNDEIVEEEQLIQQNKKTIPFEYSGELKLEHLENESSSNQVNAFQTKQIIQNQSMEEPEIKIQKNWNLVLEPKEQQLKLSESGTKNVIKALLSKNLNIFSNSNLNDIIEIRENLLRQREISEYKKLNSQLQTNKVDFQEFQSKLISLQNYIENEKKQISKAKQEIERGLKVAAKVVAKTQRDAQILGKSLGFSKSEQSLKKIRSNIYTYDMLQSANKIVYVDERKYKTTQPQKLKNFFADDSNSSDGSDLDFTEQELKRFKDPKFSNLQFCDMNKNIMISQEFLKSHKIQSFQKINTNKTKISIPELAGINQKKHASKIIENILEKLLLEIVLEIYQHKNIFETLSMKFDISLIKPSMISLQQILNFINLIENNLPEKALLLKRLNQQISPTPLQLLKCMRVDFYEDDQISFQQSGKYQFIIPQQVCIETISKINLNETEVILPKKNLIDLNEVSEETKKYIESRQSLLILRHQECKRKKSEVFNILMHCVFDAWNEQIISLKSKIPGFSGIGLNQSTESLINHNDQIDISEVDSYIKKSKEKIKQIITDDSDLNTRINQMAYEQMCNNEANWICYTDEALGYVLELDYIIGQQLMAQVARFLHKRIGKSPFAQRLIKQI